MNGRLAERAHELRGLGVTEVDVVEANLPSRLAEELAQLVADWLDAQTAI
jgi:hypothetical protein